MFNVQPKTTGSQFSLLHEPNKRLMKKPKKETTEQSSVSKGSPIKEGLWWEGFKERYLLSLEWQRVGVMESKSGDDGTEELRQLG